MALLTVDEAATRWAVHQKTTLRCVGEGRAPIVVLGPRCLRVAETDLRWIETRLKQRFGMVSG